MRKLADPIRFVSDGKPQSVVQASEILTASTDGMLDKILDGKKLLFVEIKFKKGNTCL